MNSKWKCPKCKSTKIQVSYPTWYHETKDELKFVETDAEATILWWYCEGCEETDKGEPERVSG